MGDRPLVAAEVFFNLPIMNTAGTKPIAVTGLIIPVIIFLDKILGDKTQMTDFGDSSSYSQDSNYYSKYDTADPAYSFVSGQDYYSNDAVYSSYPNKGQHYSSEGTKYPSPFYSTAGGSQQFPYAVSSSPVVLGNARRSEALLVSEVTECRHHFGNPSLDVLYQLRLRSVGLDQASLYQHLEGSLAIVGLEGRTCLLRLVCDAQSPALLRLNLMGSLLAAIFTPREEAVMEEYKEAARVGRARESCAKHYPSCPFSIFNIFNPKRNSQTSKPSLTSKTSKTPTPSHDN
ncbi:putative DM4/DM12 family-like protein 16 [Homarus americanus]|uniref:Putative DM4/DM12 family-like protein 16 n=1 Tax=Homarus americanus TaxID=6706 RepID=A0A8J5N5A9_HOMAM|nr:putative DM4/DM12 family-like protein 16 [Homarus americanus]